MGSLPICAYCGRFFVLLFNFQLFLTAVSNFEGLTKGKSCLSLSALQDPRKLLFATGKSVIASLAVCRICCASFKMMATDSRQRYDYGGVRCHSVLKLAAISFFNFSCH